MSPRVVIACVLALVLVGPSAAAPQELIRGLTYDRSYVAEVTATNELGSVSLGASFTVHRASVFRVAK